MIFEFNRTEVTIEDYQEYRTTIRCGKADQYEVDDNVIMMCVNWKLRRIEWHYNCKKQAECHFPQKWIDEKTEMFVYLNSGS